MTENEVQITEETVVEETIDTSVTKTEDSGEVKVGGENTEETSESTGETSVEEIPEATEETIADETSEATNEEVPEEVPEIVEPTIPPYGVYVLTDENNKIISINSDAFLTDPLMGWTKIDEGYGDKYHHAQNNYLDKPCWAEGGVLRYKLVDGEIVERSQEEIDEEIASLPEPEESNENLLMETAADHEYRICLLELGLTEDDLFFEEDE